MSDIVTGAEPSQTQATTGLDHAPTPESNGKYAKYYELNKPKEEAGTSTETNAEKVNVEKVEAEKPKPQEPKQKREWTKEDQHRVDVVTAQKKRQAEAHQRELQAVRDEMNALREEIKGKSKPAEPEFKRENFASDEEYIDHRAEVKAKAATKAAIEEFQQQQRKQAQEQQDNGQFRNSWTAKVNANFPDANERAEFVRMLDGAPDTLTPDVHEFVQFSDVGAKMLKAILGSPGMHDALMSAPASVRAVRLGQLENAIYDRMGQASAPVAPAPQVKKVSQAPAPIGQIANVGSSSPVELSTSEQVRAYKQAHYKG